MRSQRQARGDANGSRIAGLPHIQSGVPRCRAQQLEIVLVEQIARPYRDRPAVGPPETCARVDERIPVDDQITGVARARRERRTITGVDPTEDLPGPSNEP